MHLGRRLVSQRSNRAAFASLVKLERPTTITIMALQYIYEYGFLQLSCKQQQQWQTHTCSCKIVFMFNNVFLVHGGIVVEDIRQNLGMQERPGKAGSDIIILGSGLY